MPNTKSAERRVRSNARKHLRNKSVKSRIKTLERHYKDALEDGDKNEATTALRTVTSALDKAAKKKILNRTMASRKISRLSVKIGGME
jgi:small subunit ribosomal protein S20